MHILIAPNAFKGSLDATQAALAIQDGLKQSGLRCTTELFPIADGGDGTSELIIKSLNGAEVKTTVADPLNRRIESSFGLIDQGQTAVIEMANASGLRLLKSTELNPMIALSTGTGELMKAALDHGAKKMIITMGGSATVDGGVGMMHALGVVFFGRHNQPLKDLPGSLTDLETVDISQLDARLLKTEVVVLCDVNNLLLGENGAAAVFGPQKGASPEQVSRLDNGLKKLADILHSLTGRRMDEVMYGGTAGGAAAGLYAMIDAKLLNGIDHFLKLTAFDEAIRRSTLLITGEGRIDEQTLHGKGPFGVAKSAKQMGIPVVGLAGTVTNPGSEKLREYFNQLISINDSPDIAVSMKNTKENLKRVSKELGENLKRSQKPNQ